MHVLLIDSAGRVLVIRGKLSKSQRGVDTAKWNVPGGDIADLGGEGSGPAGTLESPQESAWRHFEEQTGFRLGNSKEGARKRGGVPCWPFNAELKDARTSVGNSVAFVYSTAIDMQYEFGPDGSIKSVHKVEEKPDSVSLFEASNTNLGGAHKEFFGVMKTSQLGFPKRHFKTGQDYTCMSLITRAPGGQGTRGDVWHLLDKTGKDLDILLTNKGVYTPEQRAARTPDSRLLAQLADCAEALDVELTAAVGAIEQGPQARKVKGRSTRSITPGSGYSHEINAAKVEYNAERDVAKLESTRSQFVIPEDKDEVFQMPGWRASLRKVSKADPSTLDGGEQGGNLDAVKSTAK